MTAAHAIILAGKTDTPLIESQLGVLRSCAIRDVTVVAGFEMGRPDNPRRDFARFIHNRFFDNTGTLFSLWLARSVPRLGAVIVNGGVTLTTDTMTRFIEMPIPDAMLIDPDMPAKVGVVKVGPEGGRCLVRHVEALVTGGAADACATLAFRSMAKRWPVSVVFASEISERQLAVAV